MNKSYNEGRYNDANYLIDRGIGENKPFRNLGEISKKLKCKVPALRSDISRGRVDPDNLEPIVAHAYVDEYKGRVWTTEALHPEETMAGWHDQGNLISIGIHDKQDAGIEVYKDGLVAAEQNEENRTVRKMTSEGTPTLTGLRSARTKRGLTTPTAKQVAQARKNKRARTKAKA